MAKEKADTENIDPFRQTTIDRMLNDGAALHQAGNLTKASMVYTAILELNPNNASANHLLGVIYLQNGEVASAIAKIETAVANDINNAEFFNNLGSAYQENDQFIRAQAAFTRAIELRPEYSEAFYNRANLFKKINKLPLAIQDYDKALELNPNFIKAMINLGVLYYSQNQYIQALDYFEKANNIEPDDVNIAFNLGAIYTAITKYQEAKQIFLSLREKNKVQVADINNNLGTICIALCQYDEAKTYLQEAICQDSDLIDAKFNLGLCYFALNEIDAAYDVFKSLLGADSDWPYICSSISYCALIALKQCDWITADNYTSLLIQQTENLWEKQRVIPLDFFTISQLDCSSVFKTKVAKDKARQFRIESVVHKYIKPDRNDKQKIHVGYISSDFYNNDIGLLIQDLFKFHDRENFTVSCYYTGRQNDEITSLIQASCDNFHDISTTSIVESVALIRANEVDVLIDLSGYRQNSRPGILAMQPAPVQCNMLSTYSMEADFIQYYITHENLKNNFTTGKSSELFLPRYIATKYIHIEGSQPPNTEFALIKDKFVFCYHGDAINIDEITFSAWLSILQNTKNSVLWLYLDNNVAKNSLIDYADDRGVSRDRIIFGKHKVSIDGFHKYANLWLEPFNKNESSGILLAAMAQLPALVLEGTTPQSKLAANIQRDLNRDSLIAASESEYQEKAISLANEPDTLTKICFEDEVDAAKTKAFNQQAFMQQLERGIDIMWKNYKEGLTAESIFIKSDVN